MSEILSGPTSHTASEWQSTSVTCVFCVNREHWAGPRQAQARLGRIVTKQMAPWLGRNHPSASWWLMTMVLIHIKYSGHCLLWSLYHCKICTLLHLMATWHCTVYCPLYTLEYLYATPSNKLAQLGWLIIYIVPFFPIIKKWFIFTWHWTIPRTRPIWVERRWSFITLKQVFTAVIPTLSLPYRQYSSVSLTTSRQQQSQS